MSLFWKMAGLDFIWALVLVAATRAYVAGNYSATAVLEAAAVAILVWDRRLAFDDERSRSWNYGFPARALGSVAGSLLGMYLSIHVLGR